VDRQTVLLLILKNYVKFQVILIGYMLSLGCIFSLSAVGAATTLMRTTTVPGSAYLQIRFVEVCFVTSLFCAIKLMKKASGEGASPLPKNFLINTTMEMFFEVILQLLYEKIVHITLFHITCYGASSNSVAPPRHTVNLQFTIYKFWRYWSLTTSHGNPIPTHSELTTP